MNVHDQQFLVAGQILAALVQRGHGTSLEKPRESALAAARLAVELAAALHEAFYCCPDPTERTVPQ